jgi:hypothetical protein
VANLRTITVAKLIELLEDESPDARVIVGADYGDYHHTDQALPLRGEVETVIVEASGYSASGFAIIPDGGGEYEPGVETFLVLR